MLTQTVGLWSETLTRRNRWPLVGVFLLGLAIPACSPTRTLGGFSNYALAGYSDDERDNMRKSITRQINAVREAIRAATPHDQGRRSAMNTLYDALLSLSNGHPDYLLLSSEYENYVLKQVLPPERRPPAQLYPRLTHPHIAEIAAASETAGSTVEPQRTWFVPVVLSRRALTTGSPTRFGAFVQRARENCGARDWNVHRTGRFLRRLAFWLEPRSINATASDAWISLSPDEHQDIPCSRFFNLTLPDSSALGVTFSIAKGDKTGLVNVAKPGFYHLRIAPKLTAPAGCQGQTEFAKCVFSGNWRHARKRLIDDLRSDPNTLANDLSSIVRGVRSYHSSRLTNLPRVTYFRKELCAFSKACGRLAREIRKIDGNESHGVAAAKRKVDDAIDELLNNEHPAPVSLDDSRHEQSFSFVVAADLQYHRDVPQVERFLDLFKGEPFRSNAIQRIPCCLRTRVQEAKFILFAGDMADGAAGSVAPLGNKEGHGVPELVVWNALGIFPPQSPYTYLKEFVNVRHHLRDLRIPIFAVPGNHDGMVGYGGVLNFPLDSYAELLNEFPFIRHNLARWLFRGNDFIPNGVKFHVPLGIGMVPRHSRVGKAITPQQGDGVLSWFFAPRYDGLVEWRWHLGPLNVAFNYHGHSFAGLNTYNLSQPDRAAVGPLVSNWGGGIRAKDAVWLQAILADLAERRGDAPKPRQFLFMHHDPRGFTPADFGDGEIQEVRRPAFDTADAWMNYLTLGYAGLQYAPSWGLFIPIITPLFDNAVHWLRFPYRWNREWTAGYGEEALVKVVDGLDRQGHLSHLFLGHNDLPTREQSWRRNGRLFPKGLAKSSWIQELVAFMFKSRLHGQPTWSVALDAHSRESAAKVIRLDDVATLWEPNRNRADRPQSYRRRQPSRHGFHLVTVHQGPRPSVDVHWVPLLDE